METALCHHSYLWANGYEHCTRGESTEWLKGNVEVMLEELKKLSGPEGALAGRGLSPEERFVALAAAKEVVVRKRVEVLRGCMLSMLCDGS
jgi:hypothetical protein